MTKWKVKVRGLRSLLNTDDSDEEAQRVSKEIFKLIGNNSIYRKAFIGFGRLLDFKFYIETTEELNELLDDMYDYCDRERIWIDFD